MQLPAGAARCRCMWRLAFTRGHLLSLVAFSAHTCLVDRHDETLCLVTDNIVVVTHTFVYLCPFYVVTPHTPHTFGPICTFTFGWTFIYCDVVMIYGYLTLYIYTHFIYTHTHLRCCCCYTRFYFTVPTHSYLYIVTHLPLLRYFTHTVDLRLRVYLRTHILRCTLRWLHLLLLLDRCVTLRWIIYSTHCTLYVTHPCWLHSDCSIWLYIYPVVDAHTFYVTHLLHCWWTLHICVTFTFTVVIAYTHLYCLFIACAIP